MAKWGEGDPRWIVEERADATNVNNWHWTEKNATQWSKDKLRSLLIGLKIEGAAGVAELKEFTTLDGEASANNRKSKLIFFYEWDIKMKWKGLLNTDDMDEVSGTLTIPNLSDEQDIPDIDVDVTVKEKHSGAQTLKELVRTRGADQIRECLATYLDSLRQEFSQGMILPTDMKKNDSSSNLQNIQTTNNLASEFKQAATIAAPPTKPVSPSTGVKISTKKISMKEQFMCSREELYRALTEQNMVGAFTRAPVTQWDVSVGGKFVLFDGMISGEFQQLIPNDTIVQRWRMKSWPDGHHSVATIKLTQSPNCTTLTLSQTGIPSAEADRTKEGWQNYYWNSIRQAFGFAVDINF